jgi:hypothetical protein
VWLAFVLMLTIFHHPKTKTFCMASSLVQKKMLATLQVSFFFSVTKLDKQKLLLSDDENSASAQRHATHRGKISGRYNLC